MKKLIYLIAILVLTAFAGNAQNMKSKTKSQPGHVPVQISSTVIHHQTGLKSASAKFKVSPALQLPGKKSSTEIDKIFKDGNTPVYIEISNPGLKSAGLNPEDILLDFTNSLENTLRLNSRSTFSVTEDLTGSLGMRHIKTIQEYKGIPIYGSEGGLHISSEKIRYTGKIYSIEEDINPDPEISQQMALGLVNQDLKTHTAIKELSTHQKQLLDYKNPVSHLVFFNRGDEFSLAYEIEVRPNFLEVWKYFVDASTGEIIRSFNATATDGPATATATDLNGVQRTIDTYLENGDYYLADVAEDMYNASTGDGMIITFDANNTSSSDLDFSYITSADNTWNHPFAVSAHYNATVTYRYFKNTFNRNSINGQGGSIISLVNVTNDDGSSMANAYWNGKAAFYGSGGDDFKPLAGALDVSAHELGHGVVSTTANLEYYDQSGAMNEMYADIFGSMVDRDDWLIGEDVTNDGSPLRNMQDPANGKTNVFDGWQPQHMSELVTGDVLDNFVNRDNEGVHINNGIGNHAYYLYATAVTKEKAEQAFYRALTVYLNKTSKYIDLRIAVVQAAKDLYGDNSVEVQKAEEAFDEVGIYDEEQVDSEQDYTENPGQDYLISYDTNEADSNTLYRSSTSGTDFVGLTTTDMKSKVSVTDDGSAAVFVSTDDKLRAIDLSSNEEVILSDEAFWDNVAVSKDGNRLACISTEIDTAIYVYDFNSQSWGKFILYNPTTSHDNSTAGGVLYADAIEFDHTGEYLIYDAYNYLASNTTEDIYYWDIGFIKVWDNQSNSFGNGTISKLFESLPDNVSIGNPVFSKNSPYIIAFDYFDPNNDEYAIIGANLDSGETDVIFLNTILGYPSFSKADDQIAFSALSTENNEVVGVIGLGDNKISASGDASLLISDAKWPVYYSTGKRPLGLKPTSNFTADLKTGEAPVQIRFIDLSINNPTSWEWHFVGGTPEVSSEQNPEITYYSPGLYQVSLTTQNEYGSHTLTKTEYILVSDQTDAKEIVQGRFNFYPNPANKLLFIEADNPFHVSVYNLNGKKILSEDDAKELNISGLNQGVYILEVISGDKRIREKFVKK